MSSDLRQAISESVEVSGQKGCEERVVTKIRERREKGLAKYGVGVERTDLTTRDWLIHAQEEAMDLAVYLERLIQDHATLKSNHERLLVILSEKVLVECDNIGGHPRADCQCDSCEGIRITAQLLREPADSVRERNAANPPPGTPENIACALERRGAE